MCRQVVGIPGRNHWAMSVFVIYCVRSRSRMTARPGISLGITHAATPVSPIYARNDRYFSCRRFTLSLVMHLTRVSSTSTRFTPVVPDDTTYVRWSNGIPSGALLRNCWRHCPQGYVEYSCGYANASSYASSSYNPVRLQSCLELFPS